MFSLILQLLVHEYLELYPPIDQSMVEHDKTQEFLRNKIIHIQVDTIKSNYRSKWKAAISA